jgi:hypothetical protein
MFHRPTVFYFITSATCFGFLHKDIFMYNENIFHDKIVYFTVFEILEFLLKLLHCIIKIMLILFVTWSKIYTNIR